MIRIDRIRITKTSQVRTKHLGHGQVEIHSGTDHRTKTGWFNLDVVCAENGLSKESDHDTVRVVMSIADAESIIERIQNHLESFKRFGIK